MAKKSSPEETAGGAAPAPAKKKSILGKLLVVGLVVAVVAVECVVAYLCIPTNSEAATGGSAAKPPADRKKGEAEPAADENDGNVEVDLKEFSITIYQPASNSTLRIDFHLHGIVAKQDEKEFKRLFEENTARFREQVNVTVRSAEMADLTDPSLGLIKRTIMEKTKAILGRPLLKEVLITDYSSLEN